MNGLLTGLLARRKTGLIEEIENSDAEMTELRARLAEYEQFAAPVPDIAIEVRNGVSVGVFPSEEIVNPHYARGWNDSNSYQASMLAKQGMWIAGDDMQLAQYTADKKLITEYKKGTLNDLPKEEILTSLVNSALRRIKFHEEVQAQGLIMTRRLKK